MVCSQLEFEWDEKKDRLNLKKHGVSFIEAVDSFYDPDGLQFVDDNHSRVELRFYWVGKTKEGRVLTTYFTRRGFKIRIIGSAEWRKFRRVYYEATKG